VFCIASFIACGKVQGKGFIIKFVYRDVSEILPDSNTRQWWKASGADFMLWQITM